GDHSIIEFDVVVLDATINPMFPRIRLEHLIVGEHATVTNTMLYYKIIRERLSDRLLADTTDHADQIVWFDTVAQRFNNGSVRRGEVGAVSIPFDVEELSFIVFVHAAGIVGFNQFPFDLASTWSIGYN